MTWAEVLDENSTIIGRSFSNGELWQGHVGKCSLQSCMVSLSSIFYVKVIFKKKLSGQFCHYCTPHLLGKRSVDENEEYMAESDLQRLSDVPGDQMIRRVFIRCFLCWGYHSIRNCMDHENSHKAKEAKKLWKKAQQ